MKKIRIFKIYLIKSHSMLSWAVDIVTFFPFKNVYYMSSIIANKVKSNMFQFHSNFLLIALLLCHCPNLYSNNYNYDSFSDTIIPNRNSSVRYAAYDILVTDNSYELRTHNLPTLNVVSITSVSWSLCSALF